MDGFVVALSRFTSNLDDERAHLEIWKKIYFLFEFISTIFNFNQAQKQENGNTLSRTSLNSS